jgi:hypothetical protein
MPAFAEWDSFYVIVGSAAGGLIGLQFVVMTLIAERPPKRAAEAGGAFATPTIVHFGAVLLLSAVLRAPWHTIMPVAVFWGVLGLCGTGYVGVVARRLRSQGAYQPEFEDSLFHVLLPLAAYATLARSTLAASSLSGEILFSVGAATLVLLLVGIHNAWGAVVYHVMVNIQNRTQ